MTEETQDQRSTRILTELREQYPGANTFDLNGRGEHFVCEVEPTKDHPEYNRAIEVIISSKPHKHLKIKSHFITMKWLLITA